MANQPDETEQSEAARKVQRVAEQEALRKVRKLTDDLEEEQRTRRRTQRWGLVVAGVALLAVLIALGVVYLKGRNAPPAEKIEVPAKIVLPQK
jgi:hypothetical protein